MINLTDENFERETSNAQKPVLVDFWMLGCAPCLILSPILEKLAKEYEDKIVFAKANFDAVQRTCQQYGINSAPTVIIFKEGKPISGFIGIRPELVIREWLENFLKDNSNEGGRVEEVIKEYEEYAQKNGFSLNPNKKVVEGLVKSLLEREKRFGARYCPCRKITGNKEEDRKLICPCQFHREEIERDGYCLCRLFVK
ncbi:MAG: thioredoxin domain-containing protein [Candidatus Paceibacterales bacterium]